MAFWKRILEFLRPRRAARRSFQLDERVIQSLHDLARREQLPADQVASNLLGEALQQRQAAEQSLLRWQELTPREQQVVALICLNYTTRQIALRLTISPETVKTHAHHAMTKFGAHNREDLRRVLVNWDFSRWDCDL